MMAVMRNGRFFSALAIFAVAIGTAAGMASAHEPLYKNGRQILLIRPDGTELDYIPEYGTVTMGRDAEGRQTLLDRNGNLVATEVDARDYRSRDNLSYDSAPPRSNNGRWNDDSRPDWRYGSNAPDWQWQQSDFGNQNAEPDRYPAPNSGFGTDRQTDRPYQPAPVQAASKFDMNVVALQVLLDREGFSPGVIDGHMGDNVEKALEAYEQKNGRTFDADADREDILSSLALNGGLPVKTYTITSKDAAGPFVASIPSDYGEKALLPEMSYTSVEEMLAEKFHMDERLLRRLNPEADFTRPGTTIKVINTGPALKAKVARIVADKSKKQVFAYDAEGTLVAAYPATIGSTDTPSPSGTVTIERIAINPSYTYNPKKNFKQGNNDQVLTINPGPNGPVGDVWIALSKPSYGIHGTPDPSKIGKTSSHGCVRLTNWDARELAGMVSPGVTVEFTE